MIENYSQPSKHGGAAPATPGFNAVAPEWLLSYGAAVAAPVIPAPESALRLRPRRAVSSAQVSPEWINHNSAVDQIPSDGANSLTSCLSPGVQFTHGSSPPTPPDMRVRIRRFGGLSNRLHS